jgi:multidrug efflux pump
MLGVTFFGLFLTPLFYVLLRTAARGLARKDASAAVVPVQMEGTH